jgi:predicted short-subunit dehydrogenase-like oxidoreductase (DUF2520 family)
LKSSRLTIGVIGSDSVGIALALALQDVGHEVVARSGEDNEPLAAMFPMAKYTKSSELASKVDLVLLAIKSSELVSAIEQFSKDEIWKTGQLVLHTASEFGYEILSSAAKSGAIPLAINPAMHFTGTSLDIQRIRESYFAISAPAVALPIAEALVIEIGAEPIILQAEGRAAYAEAIAVASDFSAMIVNQATGLLEQAGISNPSQVLAPVVRSAVDQALSKGHRDVDPEQILGDV